MIDENHIHPEALKTARRRVNGGTGLTQAQLAEAIGCTKETISRWERGISRRVRSHLRKPLCEALKVNWEVLTKPPERVNIDSRGLSRIQRWVSPHVPPALLLVAKRYEVTPRNVLDLAPLLFLIVAERSLLERRRRLDQMNSILNDADNRLSEISAHLGRSVMANDHFTLEMLGEEKESLSERDVFGRKIKYELWDEDDEGPFVHFVRGLTEGLPQDAVNSINSYDGRMIYDYQIADDTLRNLIGVAEDDSDEVRKNLHYIHQGQIDLRECLTEREKRDEEDYKQWLLNSLSEANAEYLREWGPILDASASLDSGDDQEIGESGNSSGSE